MLRILAILRAAIADDRARPTGPSRRPEERAFLPALLEVTETPPSPTARILAWILMALLTLALLWAWFGRVDVVASAEGRTVASGRSKTIQPAEAGVITAIHVRDGQVVREGDLLIELDRTIVDAEHERLRQDMVQSLLATRRLRALLAAADRDGTDPQPLFTPPEEADAAQVAMHRALLANELGELRARRENMAQEILRRMAERETAQATIARLGEVLPLVQARAEARAELARSGNGSRLTWLEAEQQLVETRHERRIQQARITEIEGAINTLRAQARMQDAEALRTRTTELTEKEHALTLQLQDRLRGQQRQRFQTIAAPIDGVVQQLAVHTVGGVVQPAQQLMVIAPQEDRLEVEALVLNRDVGFISPGQVVEVKLEAFNFTRFGLIEGEVVSLSADAIQDEKRGLVYAARIRLTREVMSVDGRPVTLFPGMSVTAEIRTGTRRVLDYLLSPIARYRHEAIRER